MDVAAAVDVDRRARNESGEFGREEQAGASAFARRAARCSGIPSTIDSVRSVDRPSSMDVSIIAGQITLARMPVRPELPCDRAGQANHAALGGCVVRATDQAAAPLGSDRCDIDDDALPSARRNAQHALAQVEGALHVDVDDEVVVSLVDLEQRLRSDDAGAVDQAVDDAEILPGRRSPSDRSPTRWRCRN